MNDNGYVIYPDSVGKMDLDAAKEYARESSEREGEARVEDCDTEAVVARYRHGVEVDAGGVVEKRNTARAAPAGSGQRGG